VSSGLLAFLDRISKKAGKSTTNKALKKYGQQKITTAMNKKYKLENPNFLPYPSFTHIEHSHRDKKIAYS